MGNNRKMKLTRLDHAAITLLSVSVLMSIFGLWYWALHGMSEDVGLALAGTVIILIFLAGLIEFIAVEKRM
jgi:hypothetical protein